MEHQKPGFSHVHPSQILAKKEATGETPVPQLLTASYLVLTVNSPFKLAQRLLN